MARLIRSGCAALLLLAGCASKGPASGTADGAGAPVADAAPDAPPGPTSCRTLRNCVYACQTDANCIARCESSAPMAARTQYDQIHMCSLQACPDQSDIDCRCTQECVDGGQCATAVNDCDEAESDSFCDAQCH